MEITHDPIALVRDLQQILQSDKKRIGFLFGAGTSCAQKDSTSKIIPAIAKLTEQVLKELRKLKNEDDNKGMNAFINKILEENANINIEELLSKLETLSSVIGKNIFLDVDKGIIDKLITQIKVIIRQVMSVHEDNQMQYKSQLQVDFARWIGLAERKYGIEIFTTNYDYLFEIGLEYYNIPYYDGFMGSYEPVFNAGSVEQFDFLPRLTKLWKLHGSIGWALADGFINANEKRIVRKLGGDDFLIYPSLYKYSNTKKEPYISLIDRLSVFLQKDEAVLITCGYSFNDEHLNERILTSLNHNNCNTAVYALMFGDDSIFNDDSTVYRTFGAMNGKISFLGGRKAIINKRIGKWRLSKEPVKYTIEEDSTYFDEDVTPDPDIPLNNTDDTKRKGKEVWTGEGTFKLPDYKCFVEFLNTMVKYNGND